MTASFLKKPVLLGFRLLSGAACAYFIMHSASGPSDANPGSGSPAANAMERLESDTSKDTAAEALLADLRLLAEKEGALDFQALQETIQSLVRKDPQAAADFASSLGNGSMREIALHRVAQAWAGRDPGATVEWANAIRNQEERGALLNGIFCEVAQADPAKAVQMAEAYDMLAFSPGMTGNLMQQWAARDYDSARRWIEGQPSGSQRDQMFCRLALVRCGASPEEAAQMVSERIAPGGVQEEAAITIVSRWAATDPEAATAWAKTFAAGDFRERALNEIALTADKPGD